ncbi:MAG TPA: AzlD domain-containing protein [Mycetocola sp.]|nr:AzlD domain-containing protein [Mycetocola sp.]
MTLWHVILIASIACVALKLAGYAVPPHWLEKPSLARTADLLTVALLAALIAVQTLGAGQSLVVDARVPALAAAGLLYWLRLPFLVVVIAAALVAAMLRLWGGMA